MSERKYYVGLKSLTDENVITHFFWKDHCFYRGFEKSRCSFTKSELAEIMGGAFYKSKHRTGTTDEMWDNGWKIREDKVNGYTHWEWINPLIELVPVGEEE